MTEPLSEYRKAVIAEMQHGLKCEDPRQWQRFDRSIEVLHRAGRSADYAAGFLVGSASTMQILDDVGSAASGLAAVRAERNQMN